LPGRTAATAITTSVPASVKARVLGGTHGANVYPEKKLEREAQRSGRGRLELVASGGQAQDQCGELPEGEGCPDEQI